MIDRLWIQVIVTVIHYKQVESLYTSKHLHIYILHLHSHFVLTSSNAVSWGNAELVRLNAEPAPNDEVLTVTEDEHWLLKASVWVWYERCCSWWPMAPVWLWLRTIWWRCPVLVWWCPSEGCCRWNIPMLGIVWGRWAAGGALSNISRVGKSGHRDNFSAQRGSSRLILVRSPRGAKWSAGLWCSMSDTGRLWTEPRMATLPHLYLAGLPGQAMPAIPACWHTLHTANHRPLLQGIPVARDSRECHWILLNYPLL